MVYEIERFGMDLRTELIVDYSNSNFYLGTVNWDWIMVNWNCCRIFLGLLFRTGLWLIGIGLGFLGIFIWELIKFCICTLPIGALS